MDLGLGGKVAMVTGGGSGIGEAIALRLAEEGATLVAADLNGGNAKAAAAKAGPPAEGVALDISSWSQAKAVVEGIVERHGRLDVLVNCAGAWRIGPFMDAPPEDWAFEVNTNLLGTINCTRAALDPMVAQGGGKIVNISSDAGRVGEFRQAVYSGAKAGIIGFSKAVAREVGRSGVHVNVVCPGYTKTPGTAGQLDPELEARIAKSYPLRKLGLPDDVARMAVFLASDGASHITGQTISVSGGYSMV